MKKVLVICAGVLATALLRLGDVKGAESPDKREEADADAPLGQRAEPPDDTGEQASSPRVWTPVAHSEVTQVKPAEHSIPVAESLGEEHRFSPSEDAFHFTFPPLSPVSSTSRGPSQAASLYESGTSEENLSESLSPPLSPTSFSRETGIAEPGISLFPQCWPQKEAKKHIPDQREEKCHVNLAFAVPPSRHPQAHVEQLHVKDPPFCFEIPSWNIRISQARQAGSASPITEAGDATCLWNLEIVHKLLWERTVRLQYAIDHFQPMPQLIRQFLNELLDLAESLLYVEGTQDTCKAQWYYEVEQAANRARATLDAAMLTLEQVFRPASPASTATTAQTALQDVSGIETSAAGTDAFPARQPAAEEDTTARSGTVREVNATAEEATLLEERAKEVGAGDEAQSRKKDAASHRTGAKLLKGARHAVTAAAARAKAAAIKLAGVKHLFDGPTMHTLRLQTNRLLELFEARQKPLPVQHTRQEACNPICLFRMEWTQAQSVSIPVKGRNDIQEEVIASLTEVAASTSAVTLKNGAHPESVYSFLLMLTNLSKGIRHLLHQRERIPKLWKPESDELLAHAYVHLDFLLSQRRIFLSELPYEDSDVS